MITDFVARLCHILFSFIFLLRLFFLLNGLLLCLHHGGSLCLGVISILEERCCSFTCFRSFFCLFFFFFNLGWRFLGWDILIFSFDSLDKLNEVGWVFFPDHLIEDRDGNQGRRVRDLV